MAIITISRGSYSRGKEVAEAVAARLGYGCISRDVLLDASKRFNIPEVKLIRAIHDAPTLLQRMGHDRSAYMAYIRSALTWRVREDNVVYHGLAGHILLQGVSHVLKVRIIADIDNRAAAEAAREGISLEKARELLVKDDEERRRWSHSLYGKDPWDSHLYDLILHVKKLRTEDAVAFICQAANLPQFHATEASRQKLEDLALACRIKAAILDVDKDADITCEYGNLIVYSQAGERAVRQLEKRAAALLGEIPAINNLEVHEGKAPAGVGA
jgi:cytidylate kinase